MIELFSIYKKYPYTIPARVRFFNVFRYFFRKPFLEQILVKQLLAGNLWYRKLIPPVYFYKRDSIRIAQRNGISYKLDVSCLIDHSIFFCTLHEPAWQNLFKILRKDFVVFDIGANIGFLTLNFASACPDGHIFAFEPDSRSFEFLKSNVGLNRFTNISLYKIALGDRSEKMHLYKMYTNNPGANRILPLNAIKDHEQEEIQVTTLDLMTEQLSIHRIDLMKVDVEGFEIFVLQGGKKVIQEWKPILFVELAEVNLKQQGFSARMLVEYIESLNYEVKDAYTMRPLDSGKEDYHTDILCFYKHARASDE